jgi:hypothetical protein
MLTIGSYSDYLENLSLLQKPVSKEESRHTKKAKKKITFKKLAPLDRQTWITQSAQRHS